MNKIILKLLLSFIILSACGYKVIKYSELAKFEINKIETVGDSMLNFKIKRKLNSLSSEGNENKINIILNTSKNKFAKEKDTKNEISKYQIDIVVKLEVNSINKEKILGFTIKKTGDFLVDSKQSRTYEIEKKVTDLLINQTLDEIIDNLLFELNDI